MNRMDWCDEALARFCQGLGIELPAAGESLITLQFEDVGILQLERHDSQLTLWWVLNVSSYDAAAIIERSLKMTHSAVAPTLPLRCGWVGQSELLLFITLAVEQITLPTLQQAYQTLLTARQRALDR